MGDIEETLKQLRHLVGSSPKIKIDEFSNWASTQECQEILSVSPTTVKEVQAVIRGARKLGLQIRAVGRGHSWSPLFADEGHIVMDVGKLKRPDGPRLELTQTDTDQKLVTMATGVTTGDFKDYCLSHGLSFPANVILPVVQMGGVVTTGCHGVGWDVQSVSDSITRMRIIDSDGELRVYSIEEDEDMMRAVQCSLGLWGILVDLTIKVDPMVIVETEDKWIKVKDLFYNKEALKDLVTSNWSVQFLWFPFNGISSGEACEAFVEREIDCGEWDPKEDEVWCRIVNKPDKVGAVKKPQYYKQLATKHFWQAKGFQLVDSFITTFPHCAPSFLRTQINSLRDQMTGVMHQQLPHAIHFREEIEDVPVYDMEWSFSLDPDFTNIAELTQGVIELVHKEAKEGRFPINLPMEMRFIKDSDVYMCPAIAANPKYGGTGQTCYIEVLAIKGTPGFRDDFSHKFADMCKKQKGACPHWSKEWENIAGIDDFIKQAYSKQIPKFKDALKRSGADPDGMFLNNRLEKILFPSGHAGRVKALKEVESNKSLIIPGGTESCACALS